MAEENIVPEISVDMFSLLGKKGKGDAAPFLVDVRFA